MSEIERSELTSYAEVEGRQREASEPFRIAESLSGVATRVERTLTRLLHGGGRVVQVPQPGSLTFPRFTLGQRLGPDECPYLVRWIVDFGAFSIRFHRWITSDDPRYPHDHPWSFWSFVVRGTVTEHTPEGSFARGPGSIHHFTAEHRHTVEISEGGAWTILLTGPTTRPKWGFYVDGKFRKRNKFFREHGHHHPCDPGRAVRRDGHPDVFLM